MKIARLISLFLCLNILFSNMAWAMDECSLTAEFSTQFSGQLDSENNTDSADTNCNTLCAGWTHLNYIIYTVSVVTITKTHRDIASRSFLYHFIQKKPPTEPPKV